MTKTVFFLTAAILPILLGAIQPEIISAPGSGAVPESVLVLRELGRHVEQLGRSGSPCRLRVTMMPPDSFPEADQVKFSFRNNVWEVEFRADSPNWWRSPLLRQRLFTIFAAAAAGTPPPGEEIRLPDWIIAAISSQIESQLGSERIMHNNRRFPLTRVMTETGSLPDLSALITVDTGDFVPAESAAFGEMARILLESAVDLKSIPDRFVYRLLFKDAGAAGREMLATMKEQVENRGYPDFRRFLRQRLRHYAWNDFNPRPAAAMLADFTAFTSFALPKLDNEGKPTGDFEEYPLNELPRRLEGRPDLAVQRLSIAKAFLKLADGGDREIRAAAAGIAAAADQLGSGEQAAANFAAARRNYHRLLERRRNIENALLDAERHCVPPLTFYHSRLDSLRPAGDALLSREAAEWFEAVEKNYLAEY